MQVPPNPLNDLKKGIECHQFTSAEQVETILSDRQKEICENTSYEQFVLVSNVPESIFKVARISYNTKTNTAILKVLAPPEHEAAAEEFRLYFDVATKARPTTALFIGLSESALQLAINTRGCLETPGLSIQLVITLTIEQAVPLITINRWELGTRISSTTTRQSPVFAVCTEEFSITLQGNKIIVPRDLSLPFSKIFGRAPDPSNTMERDVVISQNQLEIVAERVWLIQGLYYKNVF